MALSPSEVAQRRLNNARARVTEVEAMIDDALVSARSDERVTISLEKFRDIPVGAFDALVERYRGLGWRVEPISDQRDGSYLLFSTTKK